MFALLTPDLIRTARKKHEQSYVAVLIYSVAVTFMLLSSGIMHLADRGSEFRELMIRVNHAAIFLLIAATYTPIHIIQFRNYLRWGVLIPIWTLALSGVFLKLVYIDAIHELLSLSFYLALGWAGLLTFVLLVRRNGYKRLLPICAGALAYTIGAVIDISVTQDLIPGIIRSHEIFHFFVLAGIASHWWYIRSIN